MLRSIVKKVSFATQEASNARLLVYSRVECNLHVTIRKVSVASSSLNSFLFFVHEKCTECDFEFGTECLHLAQKYGETRALLIDGPESLWKVCIDHVYFYNSFLWS